MIIFCLYNHKGGVSKTTTTFNLAHYLAKNDKRTLVVDGDPQCNITELLLANKLNELDEEEEASSKPIAIPGNSLLEILSPRLDGEEASVDIERAQAIEINKNLLLIRGSVDLSSIEDKLAESHIQRFSSKTHEKRNYVALGDFLVRFAEKNKIDCVLIDVGPSSGALTRSLVLACDAFFVPVAADRFNVQAIKTLSSILDRWMLEHEQIYEDFKAMGLPIRLGKPKFLGVISQFFKTYKGVPKKSYQYWIKQIPDAIDSNLLPILRKYSSPDLDLTSGLEKETCLIAQIPDFGGLGPIMHETGKPIFELTSDDTTWTGVTWDQAHERISNYESLLNTISAQLGE
ncbi:AAA domain-containing protein [Crenobacter luteus]|uniref:ParA family protein n=1 Tax=Crenobacter luteus TaxID=1452487 RepID=UPI00104C46E4|nr:ParA family protein [Crenobacter luteus]TCP12456.1 AAA domain-containing protein [Crenobacter luteus]